MKNIIPGTGFTVFIIFFGVALIDAFRNGDWLWAGMFVLIGIIFLLADNTNNSVTH